MKALLLQPMQRGFTLIEIMIAISIIAVLVTVPFFAFTNLTQASRDNQRKSDVSQIQAALENYKADNGVYPESLQNLIEEGYLAELPVDPQDGQDVPGSNSQLQYGYENNYASEAGGQSYRITLPLEGTSTITNPDTGEEEETSYVVLNPRGAAPAPITPGQDSEPTAVPTSTLIPTTIISPSTVPTTDCSNELDTISFTGLDAEQISGSYYRFSLGNGFPYQGDCMQQPAPGETGDPLNDHAIYIESPDGAVYYYTFDDPRVSFESITANEVVISSTDPAFAFTTSGEYFFYVVQCLSSSYSGGSCDLDSLHHSQTYFFYNDTWTYSAPPAGTYMGQWGTNGQDSGQFPGEDVLDIGIDAQGNAFVADSVWNVDLDGRQQRIQRFSSNGEFITEWGNRFENRDGLDHLISIQDGSIISVEDPDTGSIDLSGSIFSDIKSMDVYPYGRVYVHDSASRVQRFDRSGNLTSSFNFSITDPGVGQIDEMRLSDQFNFVLMNEMVSFTHIINSSGTELDYYYSYIDLPNFSTGDAVFLGADYPEHLDGGLSKIHYLVTHRTQGLIYLYTIDGSLAPFSDIPENPPFTFEGSPDVPTAAAFDNWGYVYMTFPLSDTVKKIYAPPDNYTHPNFGQVAAEWGSTGTGDGQFQNPTLITVDSQYVYVYDADLSRIQKFAK